MIAISFVRLVSLIGGSAGSGVMGCDMVLYSSDRLSITCKEGPLHEQVNEGL
jgi:hypothetical protein